MSCGCSAKAISAANDQRFESEADGTAAIHWLDPSTWATCGSCRALLNYLTILGLEGTSPSVTIVARAGSDGKTWSSIAGVESTAFTAASATPNRVMLVPSATTPLPPLVQLGLKVEGMGGVQAAARVTWSIEPRAGSGTPALALSGSQTNPIAGFDLTGTVDLLGELDVAIGVRITAAFATTVDLETSSDNTVWFIAATVALAAANDSSAVRATNLQRYARLVMRGTATTVVAWSFKAVVP